MQNVALGLSKKLKSSSDFFLKKNMEYVVEYSFSIFTKFCTQKKDSSQHAYLNVSNHNVTFWKNCIFFLVLLVP